MADCTLAHLVSVFPDLVSNTNIKNYYFWFHLVIKFVLPTGMERHCGQVEARDIWQFSECFSGIADSNAINEFGEMSVPSSKSEILFVILMFP